VGDALELHCNRGSAEGGVGVEDKGRERSFLMKRKEGRERGRCGLKWWGSRLALEDVLHYHS